MKNIGLRIVYKLIRQDAVMKIIIISVKDDNKVYKEAENRIN